MTKNEVDINKQVQNSYEVPISEYDGELTKTSMFLLPMLDISISNVDVKPYFVNAFINDTEYPNDFVRPIFVLLKTDSYQNVGYRKLTLLLTRKENYIASYSSGKNKEDHLIMFVFLCPDKFKDDYYKFKKGQYSQFSAEYKKKFPKTASDSKGQHVISITHAVVNKTDFAKDKLKAHLLITEEEVRELDEWWALPTREREYYHYVKPEIDDNPTEERQSVSEESHCEG